MGGRDVVSFSRSAGAGPAPPPWEGEAVGDRAEFKLPMLGKCMKLRPLPDQDPRREYGVIWDSCRQPGEGWGYVFEFTGKRRGRILAWMTAGGAAYACDEPLAYVPEGEPDVLASRLPEDENAGQVEARSGRGLPLRLASRYRRVPRTGTFAFEQPACDLGSYAGSKLDLRTFLAVAFLAFVHLPQESGAAVPCGRMADVVDDLLKPPLPDACDLLVHRVRSTPRAFWRRRAPRVCAPSPRMRTSGRAACPRRGSPGCASTRMRSTARSATRCWPWRARAMWEDVRALRGWAASAYAMRLAAVLAAAAFGAGIGMARAVVTVRPGSLGGQAGMSLAFDRIPFLADVLPRIEAGALADPVVACDPAAVLALLDPADRSTAFLENGFFATVQPLDAGLAERRPLWMDGRPLPASLSATLRADRACELDVLHDEDADLTALVAEALEGAESSPLASIAVLEELSARVDERECGRGLGAEAADGAPAASAAPAGGGRMPLYCANPAARALVALADGDAGTRYRKASDAAFAAHSGL